jgi:hypothetical protein
MYGSSPEHPHGEDVFYYLTLYNEPISSRPSPPNLDVDGLLKGLYRYQDAPEGPAAGRAAAAGLGRRPAVGLKAQQLLARSGASRGRVVGHLVDRAAPRRARGATSTTCCTRRSPPGAVRDRGCWPGTQGPVVAVSDWMRAVPDQISRGCRATTPRSAPTASASRTPAARPGASSTSTPSRWWWRRSPSWPSAARSSGGGRRGDQPLPAARRQGRGLTELAKPPPLAARGGCWFEGPGFQVHVGVEAGLPPALKAHPAFERPRRRGALAERLGARAIR